MTNTANPVEEHYTRPDLGAAILAALQGMGKDIDHLTPDDLAPVDEFHGGQRPATIRLAELSGSPAANGCSMSGRASAGRRDFSPGAMASMSAASI